MGFMRRRWQPRSDGGGGGGGGSSSADQWTLVGFPSDANGGHGLHTNGGAAAPVCLGRRIGGKQWPVDRK
jgi:hypothetical protein